MNTIQPKFNLPEEYVLPLSELLSYPEKVENSDYQPEVGEPTISNPDYVPAQGSKQIQDPEWTAPEGFDPMEDETPMIDNPDYVPAVGEPTMPNPDYIAESGEKMIDNPDTRFEHIQKVMLEEIKNKVVDPVFKKMADMEIARLKAEQAEQRKALIDQSVTL